jgi:hypothetical protein
MAYWDPLLSFSSNFEKVKATFPIFVGMCNRDTSGSLHKEAFNQFTVAFIKEMSVDKFLFKSTK